MGKVITTFGDNENENSISHCYKKVNCFSLENVYIDNILIPKKVCLNKIGLLRHEQVCLMRLRFERYFTHYQAT